MAPEGSLDAAPKEKGNASAPKDQDDDKHDADGDDDLNDSGSDSRSFSHSDGSQSDSSGQEGDGFKKFHENRFFMSETISQDGTHRKSTQARRMLAKMGAQIQRSSASDMFDSPRRVVPLPRPPIGGPPPIIAPPPVIPYFNPPKTNKYTRDRPPPGTTARSGHTSSSAGASDQLHEATTPRAKITRDAKWRIQISEDNRLVRGSSSQEAAEVASRSSEEIGHGLTEDHAASLTAVAQFGSKDDLGHEQLNNMSAPVGSPKLTSTEATVQMNVEEETGRTDLALSLARAGQKRLGIDVLDESQDTTLYIGYLLDTIQRLQSEVDFTRAAYEGNGDGKVSSDNESENEKEKPTDRGPETVCSSSIPGGELLHRIFCVNFEHKHHRDLYADKPKFRTNAYEAAPVLVGKTKVTSLDSYLARYSGVHFVVLREHVCAADPDPRSQYRGFRTQHASERLERLTIVSQELQKALEHVAEFPLYPGKKTDLMVIKEMDAPYTFLFHHREKLIRLMEDQPDLVHLLKPLLDYVATSFGKEYDEAAALLSREVITARHLGKLFVPNQMIVARKGALHEVFMMDSYPISRSSSTTINGWAWQYDGHQLVRRIWVVNLDFVPEDEETSILNLSAYPLKYAKQALVDKMEARGKKFWDMKGQQYASYTGWDKNKTYHYINARFMVDVATYQRMHGNALMYTTINEKESRFDSDPVTIERDETLTTKNFLLLPSSTFGFSLQDKKWVICNVESFSPIKWNEEAFKRLVLDEKTKEMIHALVEVQKTAEKMDDIISGKGNGLIVLLHGSPGTGKTLTAESVAEIAKKPLYRVTVGDIGTEAQEVEKYLKTVLYLGKIWDCVLLLDEADVFLEERTMADLQRNSLVSVFLRVLEYYEGILIITSNRVGTFDEAFKSRIQVAIHYDNLTRKSRKAIWTNFLKMIEESPQEDANMAELERRLDELSAEEMNGRQIRNALLTARQLAKHRKERLDWEHLSQVIRTSAAFNKYLKAVRGHNDDQWARESMLR